MISGIYDLITSAPVSDHIEAAIATLVYCAGTACIWFGVRGLQRERSGK